MFNFINGTMKAKRRKFTAAFKAQVALLPFKRGILWQDFQNAMKFIPT